MFLKTFTGNILQLQKGIIYKEISTKLKDAVYITNEIKHRILKWKLGNIDHLKADKLMADQFPNTKDLFLNLCLFCSTSNAELGS
jgi:hypothetical protein